MTSDELRELCKRRPVIASSIALWAADELDRLTRRVAEVELELKAATTPTNLKVVDGVRYGDCPFCGMSVANHEDLEGECK